MRALTCTYALHTCTFTPHMDTLHPAHTHKPTPYTPTPHIHLIIRAHATYRRTNSLLHTHHAGTLLRTRTCAHGAAHTTGRPEQAVHSRGGCKTFLPRPPRVNCQVGNPQGWCMHSLTGRHTHTHTDGGTRACAPWTWCMSSGGVKPGII